MKGWLPKLGMVIVGLLLLAAAAYGGYYYEHMRAVSTENGLNNKIHQLEQSQSSGGANNGAAINTADAACTSADLTVGRAATNGAAGTTAITYFFTNKSSKACTLTQSPAVTLEDGKGKQLVDAATPSSTSDKTITLQPTEKAYATVLFPNVANFDAGKCSAEASSISFVPSEGSDAISVILLGQSNCPGFAVQPFTTTAP